MKLEDFNKLIEQRSGVPVSLLTGTTPEENVEIAKRIVAYWSASAPADAPRETAPHTVPATAPETAPRYQFADWFNSYMGKKQEAPQINADQTIEALDNLLTYPHVQDNGEAVGPVKATTTREQFADRLNSSL